MDLKGRRISLFLSFSLSLFLSFSLSLSLSLSLFFPLSFSLSLSLSLFGFMVLSGVFEEDAVGIIAVGRIAN